MAFLQPRLPPSAIAKLNRKTLLVIGLGLAGLIGGLLYLQAHLHMPTLTAPKSDGLPVVVHLPASLTTTAKDYSDFPKKEGPPVATPVPRIPTPSVQTPTPAPVPPVVKHMADTQPLPSFEQTWERQEEKQERLPVPPTRGTQPPAQPVEKPKPKAWLGNKPTTMNLETVDTKKGEGVKEDQMAKGPDGAQLIKPATWAKPKYPLRTLYMSQELPGRLKNSLESDLAGNAVIELTVPIYDRFGMGQVILDKGTRIVATQEGQLSYGATRIPLKIVQFELETGEVIAMKAWVADQEGKTGLTGKVNNHFGKLVTAAAISAVLNVGVRTVAGTPSAGSFFQNPAQAAAQDVGQSVQRDASSIIDRELRVRPTIPIPAGTICSVQLGENITFSRKPYLAK